MQQYRVWANGTDMGIYEANDKEGALEAYAQDAGYASYADLLQRVPGSHPDENLVEEV